MIKPKRWSLTKFIVLVFSTLGVAAVLFLATYAGFKSNLSKSEWAAWVQAIGSISAIVVSVGIVQFQHFLQSKKQDEVNRADRRSKLNLFRWMFNSVALTCEETAEKVGKENIAWWLQAEILKESRTMLLSFPVANYPDQSLFLLVLQLSQRLKIVEAVVASLDSSSKENTQKHAADLIRCIRDDSLAGVAQATDLLIKISTKAELKSERSTLEEHNANRKIALEVWANLKKSKQ